MSCKGLSFVDPFGDKISIFLIFYAILSLVIFPKREDRMNLERANSVNVPRWLHPVAKALLPGMTIEIDLGRAYYRLSKSDQRVASTPSRAANSPPKRESATDLSVAPPLPKVESLAESKLKQNLIHMLREHYPNTALYIMNGWTKGAEGK